LQKQQGQFERNSEVLVYERIEQAYQSGHSKVLENVISEDILKLQADKNFGLAKKVLKRLQQKQIRDLSETYLTLGFKEISEKTKTLPANLEQVIKGMIAEGLVSARMDMRHQTVEFTESNLNAEYQSNPETVRLIETIEQQN
jgi:DNA-binding MarR family transcriptional regulator